MGSITARLAGLLIAVLALSAAPAAAQEPVTSDNVKFLENIPFPLRYDSETSTGTDLEFVTLTLPGSAGAPAPARSPVSPPAPAARPKGKSKGKKARKSAYRRCLARARKVRGKSRRARAVRTCKRKEARRRAAAKRRARARARRSAIDVAPSQPGVQKQIAVMGSYNNGLHLVDISDPQDPEMITSYDCGISQGDVQVFTRDDLPGRTFAAFTSDDGYAFQEESACFQEAAALGFDPAGQDGDGTFIIDITDPAKPFTVSWVHVERGSHNQTVHPSGRYLYNSNSDLVIDNPTSPAIEVIDISDLRAPKEVARIANVPTPGLGSDSHDISFSPDGTRAYSAAVSQTLVIDTTDPAKPELISRIYDPAVNVSHQAEVIDVEVPGMGARKVLVVTDEFAGALDTGQCPNGGLHMYDVSPDVEATPIKLGYWNIDTVRLTDDTPFGRCTAHVFQLHRDEGLMVIAWYNEGFRVIDIREAAGVAFAGSGIGMKELAAGRVTGGEQWSAKAPTVTRNGTFSVYANDHARGLDAFSVTLSEGQRVRKVGRFHKPGSEPQLRTDIKPGAAFACMLGARAAR